MAKKSNRWFHTAGRCSSAGRNIRPRRLSVERIEDRLLLAGDFVGGIELLTISFDNPNFIDISGSTSPGMHFHQNIQGSSGTASIPEATGM